MRSWAISEAASSAADDVNVVDGSSLGAWLVLSARKLENAEGRQVAGEGHWGITSPKPRPVAAYCSPRDGEPSSKAKYNT